MTLMKIKEYLDQNHIKYVSISHSQAFTAQEVAASAHIPGKQLAKTVIVKIDGTMKMAVLPASYEIDFQRLKEITKANEVELAAESEFLDLFPNCETGAMPPFGNLYNMDVLVADSLAEDEEISFNAGSHRELIKMAFDDFSRIVNPQVSDFSIRKH